MKPCIAITMGDPCGIGPEVISKGLNNEQIYRYCRPFVIGNAEQMRIAVSDFAPSLSIKSITGLSQAKFKPGVLDVLDNKASPIKVPLSYGRAHHDGASAALNAIRQAAEMAMSKEVDAVLTAPINKAAMHGIDFPFPGHTEFFAEMAGEKSFGMMMIGDRLKIMLASIHLSLKEAIACLNPQRLAETIFLTHRALGDDFGISVPHIAVAGLNPHASEGGLFGNEEERVVTPAIAYAKKEGIDVSGPYPADTLFYHLRHGRFDGAVALYHDQALIPIKLLAFSKGVNVTLGLPFIRTSVDHGTAYDIAGKGIADPGSFQEALKLAAKMAYHRYPQFNTDNLNFIEFPTT